MTPDQRIAVIERTAPRERALPVTDAATPMDMLRMAVSQGADLEKLERLMALQERWEAAQARKSYTEAFAAFKASAVRIIKNREVTDGPLKGKKYAELHAVVNAVTPQLSAHGLAASWKLTKDDPAWIEVTCTLTHVGGHSESVSMGGPPDAGGAKSPIQARASTVSYLERYTLKAITGLSEQGDDLDGKSDAPRVSAEQVANLQALIEETKTDKAKFLRYVKANSLNDILESSYTTCVRMLEAKRRQS